MKHVLFAGTKVTVPEYVDLDVLAELGNNLSTDTLYAGLINLSHICRFLGYGAESEHAFAAYNYMVAVYKAYDDHIPSGDCAELIKRVQTMMRDNEPAFLIELLSPYMDR